jgi:hypothetical protein
MILRAVAGCMICTFGRSSFAFGPHLRRRHRRKMAEAILAFFLECSTRDRGSNLQTPSDGKGLFRVHPTRYGAP